MPAGSNVTIDLRGHALTTADAARPALSVAGTLALADSGLADGEGGTVWGAIEGGTAVLGNKEQSKTVKSLLQS